MASARPAPVASPSFWRSPLFAVLLLVGGALLAYHNSFSVPFVFDDEPSILSNPTIRRLATAWWPPADAGGLTVAGRPVLNFSFGLNYAVSGFDVWSYHALNLLIHVAAALVLFDLVRRTLLLVGRDRLIPPSRGRDIMFEAGSAVSTSSRPRACRGAIPPYKADASLIALVIALLWLLHPLQTESVTYVIQRAESLVGLFYLLTLWCFARSTEPGAGAAWARGAFVCCLLGMATKEVMVSAPLLVALYDRTFIAGSWREVWTRRRGLHLTLAGTWLVLAGLVLPNLDRGGSAGAALPIGPVDYGLTQIYAIVHYLRLTLWPAPLILDYGSALVEEWGPIVWSALLLIPLGVASLWAGWRGRAAGFCGIFFFAVLAPSSSVVPINQALAEHRMYLPLAAVMVMVTTGLYLLLGRRALAMLAVAAVALGVATERRNTDYATNIRIYEDTVAKRPGNARAMALLADYYQRAGQLEKARDQLVRSLGVEPDVPEVLSNLGNVWLKLGETEKAIGCLQQALVLRPDDHAALNNLAGALTLAGRAPEAIAQLEAALQRDPAAWATRFNLASLQAQGGRLTEAAANFEAVLAVQPEDTETRVSYATLLQTQGRQAEALVQLEAAVRLQPANADLHNKLGIVLGRAGRLREALQQFEEALRLDPANESARQNAALARRRLGG
ncbi:MAG: tetratricopeptide repeat protein [Lacunisphaera sp.]|nr:tetratricopeptide repeat protein [Lacunisphaera sp.]